MAARPTNPPEVMTEKELAKADSPKVTGGQEVAIARINYSDDDLRALTSFEDAVQLLAANDVDLVRADETLGNGFTVINDKSNLCGVPLMLLGWQFNAGDMGGFVSVYVLAKLPGVPQAAKLIINDGSTGIYKQLNDYSAKTGRFAGMLVSRGLTRSDYTYEDESTGEKRPATTFYLDTSAA